MMKRKTRLRDIIHGNENYTFDTLSKKALTYDWKKISSELNSIGVQYSQIKSEISKNIHDMMKLICGND